MTNRERFERDVNNFLSDNCVGMDDHGPGVGPVATEKDPEPCEKCVEMRTRLLRLCELYGFIPMTP